MYLLSSLVSFMFAQGVFRVYVDVHVFSLCLRVYGSDEHFDCSCVREGFSGERFRIERKVASLKAPYQAEIVCVLGKAFGFLWCMWDFAQRSRTVSQILPLGNIRAGGIATSRSPIRTSYTRSSSTCQSAV